MTATLLSADSTIAAWQAHPVGSTIVAGLADQAGIPEPFLRIMRNVSLRTVIGMSPDAPEGLMDTLVAQANGGVTPTVRMTSSVSDG